MLRAAKSKSSDIAMSFVDEGDDIHMTSSFRPSEENSSIVGNASCIGSIIFHPPKSLKKEASDDGYSESVRSTLEVSDTEGPKLKILPRVSLKNGFDRAQKLLPWKLNAFLVRPRQSKAIQEYQEMVDAESPVSETESNMASYAGTMKSIRSSRVNVVNGRPLLSRQFAQVMGRPSVAYNEWDIGSTLSSSGSSSASSSRRLGRRLSWENSSLGAHSDISQITGDSFRSKRSDYTLSRAMYVNIAPNLLEMPEEEEETVENENSVTNSKISESSSLCASATKFDIPPTCISSLNKSYGGAQRLTLFSDSSRMKNLGRKAKNNVNLLLPKKNKEYSQLSRCDLFSANSNETATMSLFDQELIQSRLLSNSDLVFELQRRKGSTDVSMDEHEIKTPSRSNYQATIEEQTDPLSDSVRIRSYSDSVVPHTILMEHKGSDEETGPLRSRCASDNFPQYEHWHFDTRSNDFDYFEFEKDCGSEGNSDSFHNSTISASGNSSKLAITASGQRLYRRNSQQGSESIPLLSDQDTSPVLHRRMSNPEYSTTKAFGTIPSPSQWHRQGALVSCDREMIHPTGLAFGTSGEEVALGGINNEQAPKENNHRQTVLQPVQRLSCPAPAGCTAITTSSALRPPSASTMSATLPTQGSTYAYYWSDGSGGDCDAPSDEDEEVLWSLDPLESFEDMF